jgi:hypothetical protein
MGGFLLPVQAPSNEFYEATGRIDSFCRLVSCAGTAATRCRIEPFLNADFAIWVRASQCLACDCAGLYRKAAVRDWPLIQTFLLPILQCRHFVLALARSRRATPIVLAIGRT